MLYFVECTHASCFPLIIWWFSFSSSILSRRGYSRELNFCLQNYWDLRYLGQKFTSCSVTAESFYCCRWCGQVPQRWAFLVWRKDLQHTKETAMSYACCLGKYSWRLVSEQRTRLNMHGQESMSLDLFTTVWETRGAAIREKGNYSSKLLCHFLPTS